MPFPETFPWIFDIWTSAIKYIIEVHDSSGNLVAVLENAHTIQYTEAINTLPTLSFSLPADDTKAANIIKANEIWLMDYETNQVQAKFRLSGRGDGRASTIITTVDADGLIGQLADEQLITAYAPESLTITQIVTALLALQVLSPAITLGTIAPTATRSMTFNPGDTILKALYSLRETIGGFIYVDNDRVLQWANSIGEDTGQQVRYQKNLVGITREINYTTIANRIYAYGVGQGDARVKLSDAAGSPPDYVEDVQSQTDWGGIFVKVFVEPSITDADALLAWANLKLADLHDPIITYTVDTTDLSQSTEAGFEFEPLQLGSIITVIDEDLGLDVSVHVVKITHPDLLHPELVQIEVTNLTSSNPGLRTRDILDVIAGLLEDENTLTVAPPSPTRYSAIVFIIDGGGEAITTGQKGHIQMPFDGEVVSVSLLADQSGDIVIDIWKDIYANFPPTVADTITASAKPTILSGVKDMDTTLTGWTKTFAEGDVLAFNVDSITDIWRVTLTLVVRRT